MSGTNGRTRWSTALVALTVSGLITALPTGAQAAEGSPACTLRPNPHVSTVNPWGSCVSVAASLSALPAVGESAQLTVEVTAQFARPDVRVEVDLPVGLEWEQVPAGLGVSQVAAAVPADRGGLHRAGGATALAAGGTKRFTGRVRATAAGPADIAARAVSAGDEHAPVPVDHVYLTVADRGGRSASGMAGSAHSAATATKVTAGRVAPRLIHRPAAASAAPVPVDAHVQGTTALAGTACVTGGWAYTDSAFAVRSSPNYGVQVWDRDNNDAHDLLGVVATDSAGNYTVCFDNTDTDGGTVDGGQDVYVRFIAENNMWRVQETGTGKVFSYDSTVAANLAAGATHNFGQLQPTDPLHWLGVQAFDAVNDFWYWKPGGCWDALDVDVCPKVIVNWRWDSTVGTHYDPNPVVRQVFLKAVDPISRDVTVHEATHSVMDDVYEYSAVPGAGGAHNVHTRSTAGLAWVEGFAEWTPAQVYNDPVWNWPDGKTIDLESATWGSTWADPPLGTFGWDNGDTVEGRVAGALIDLSDSTNEAPWDRLSEEGLAPGHIWTTFLSHKSNSFSEFWAHRSADGFTTSVSALASLYQNTIDYTFRDPLTANSPVSRPTPPTSSHNFSYNTTNNAWSVVALRPASGSDYDLRVYDDKAQSVQKGSSVIRGAVDFVAVNSNTGKTPLGDFYPRVTAPSGPGGTYALEFAQSSTLLQPAGSLSVAMTSSRVVAVRDTMLTAGVPVTIRVTPGSSSQDAELFVVGSVDGSSSTYVRSRVTATASATAGGPGAVETITFTPATSGWHGVVLVNKAGSGTYTLQRL
ncbi:hypothetical protein [Lentzea sp.]|uniref:hypothetical protein n=1 Tax=Lentzea sp. TaxID=56099 RepID=UPI002B7B08A5|nr:hypothetical protein [Lentzea sp.]HUQ56494.1 hypothetical protein [Lentzea sp.]